MSGPFERLRLDLDQSNSIALLFQNVDSRQSATDKHRRLEEDDILPLKEPERLGEIAFDVSTVLQLNTSGVVRLG